MYHTKRQHLIKSAIGSQTGPGILQQIEDCGDGAPVARGGRRAEMFLDDFIAIKRPLSRSSPETQFGPTGGFNVSLKADC